MLDLNGSMAFFRETQHVAFVLFLFDTVPLLVAPSVILLTRSTVIQTKFVSENPWGESAAAQDDDGAGTDAGRRFEDCPKLCLS